MLPVSLDIQKFPNRQIIDDPLAICGYTWYISESAEEQIFIPIFIAIGDYKNIELVWNTSIITV
jgi:hypothetical protein